MAYAIPKLVALYGFIMSMFEGFYQDGKSVVASLDAEFAASLPQTASGFNADTRGQVDTVISAVVIIAVAFVGLVIVGMLYNAMPDTGNEEVDNASSDLLTGFVDAMGFVEIIVLVLFAVIVIGAVQRMRAR